MMRVTPCLLVCVTVRMTTPAALPMLFKRIALRCEKTAKNFASFVAISAGFILIKSVHTA